MQKPDPRHATSIQRSRVGRSRRRVAGTAVLVLAGAGLAPLVAATPASAAAQSVTFSTPGLHTFIVPDSVTSITVDAIGGAGGSYQQSGGAGAEVTGTFAVTPGDRIPVHVASDGAFQSARVAGAVLRTSGSEPTTCSTGCWSPRAAAAPAPPVGAARSGGTRVNPGRTAW